MTHAPSRRVENAEALAWLAANPAPEGACVVTSMPDDVKGERLVAFYTDPDLTPQELWDRLSATALPKLWVPKREDLRSIEAVPTLGTGKTDLRAVRQLALKPKSGGQGSPV